MKLEEDPVAASALPGQPTGPETATGVTPLPCRRLAMEARTAGLVFANLVEFDSLYGHRRDADGYAQALKDFDRRLPEILGAVGEDDTLIIVSDHGNDPTWPGTDHTREYGMLLAYRPGQEGSNLGTRRSFADVGATVAELLDVDWDGNGESFARTLKKQPR